MTVSNYAFCISVTTKEKVYKKRLGITFITQWSCRLVENYNQQIEAREMHNSEARIYSRRAGGCDNFRELSDRGTRRQWKRSNQHHGFRFLSRGNHTERSGIHEVKYWFQNLNYTGLWRGATTKSAWIRWSSTTLDFLLFQLPSKQVAAVGKKTAFK